MAVRQYGVLSKATHVSLLPPSWGTLQRSLGGDGGIEMLGTYFMTNPICLALC